MKHPKQTIIATIDDLLTDWKGPDHAPTPPENWSSLTIPQFLDGMARWLEVHEQAWINDGEEPPTDGWVVFEAALRMGAFYE